MRVLRENPGEAWEAVEVENALKSLQEAVGGYLESFTFAADACVLCDEEGRLKGKQHNISVCGVPFVGTILIVGVDGENFNDLTERQEEALRSMGVVS